MDGMYSGRVCLVWSGFLNVWARLLNVRDSFWRVGLWYARDFWRSHTGRHSCKEGRILCGRQFRKPGFLYERSVGQDSGMDSIWRPGILREWELDADGIVVSSPFL